MSPNSTTQVGGKPLLACHRGETLKEWSTRNRQAARKGIFPSAFYTTKEAYNLNENQGDIYWEEWRYLCGRASLVYHQRRGENLQLLPGGPAEPDAHGLSQQELEMGIAFVKKRVNYNGQDLIYPQANTGGRHANTHLTTAYHAPHLAGPYAANSVDAVNLQARPKARDAVPSVFAHYKSRSNGYPSQEPDQNPGTQRHGSHVNGHYYPETQRHGSHVNGHYFPGTQRHGSHVNGHYYPGTQRHGSHVNRHYYPGTQRHGSHVNGHYSYVIGNDSEVNGHRSFVHGDRSQVNGHDSHVHGNDSQVNGNGSHAHGNGLRVNGHGSYAHGNGLQVNGHDSHLKSHGSQVNGHAPQMNVQRSKVNGKARAPSSDSNTGSDGYIEMDEDPHKIGALPTLIPFSFLGSKIQIGRARAL